MSAPDATGPRAALLQRADVPDDDIDDIIGIAARLQDEAKAKAQGVTRAELEKVAEELDVDPSYIEDAITTLAEAREKRAAAEAARLEQEALAAETTRRMLLTGGAVVGGITVLGGLATGAGVLMAGSSGSAAALKLNSAKANLVVVLDRQAALAPQLVAMAGGRSKEITRHARALASTGSIEDKLAESQALSESMSAVLAELPPGAIDENTRHEIVGILNRISTERRRYEEAKLTLEAAESGLFGGLAKSLGIL